MHEQLSLMVSEKQVTYVATVLREAKNRGEITISDPDAMAYFFVFGQMGILRDKSIPEAEKAPRIQACLLEMLQIG
jgi:hypothetical protein